MWWDYDYICIAFQSVYLYMHLWKVQSVHRQIESNWNYRTGDKKRKSRTLTILFTERDLVCTILNISNYLWLLVASDKMISEHCVFIVYTLRTTNLVPVNGKWKLKCCRFIQCKIYRIAIRYFDKSNGNPLTVMVLAFISWAIWLFENRVGALTQANEAISNESEKCTSEYSIWYFALQLLQQ